jgi:hypothetical protein
MRNARRGEHRGSAGADNGPHLAAIWGIVDTLVDPVEVVSSSHMRAAAPAKMPRGSLPSIDPEAQVQWFSRVFEDEAVSTIDVEVLWDEEGDTSPTLVQRRRSLG